MMISTAFLGRLTLLERSLEECDREGNGKSADATDISDHYLCQPRK